MEKPRAASSASTDARATYGSRLRTSHSHAHVVLRSSFRFSLRIFEQKRDCSQSKSVVNTSHRLNKFAIIKWTAGILYLFLF